MDLKKNRSCETQLLEFTDDISKNLEEGKQNDVLVMDFAKAFGKVCHILLLHKLMLQQERRWCKYCFDNFSIKPFQ